jgi:hypothetical protein
VGGGKVLKAPANIIMLFVATPKKLVIYDPALAVKLMHVIEAATKATFGHHHLNHKRIKAVWHWSGLCNGSWRFADEIS